MMSLYTPLDSAKHEIRLVSFSKLTLDNIECELCIASLDAAPNYTALSYLWGNPDRLKSIFVNNFPLAITETLFDALRVLYANYSSNKFWIDAICIDQKNTTEKVS